MDDIQEGGVSAEPYSFDREIGNTGLERYDGWVNEEWLRDLKGLKGIKKYKEMRDNDPTVGAFLFAIEMLARQARWYIEPAGDTDADKEAAEFAEQCLFKDMEQTFDDTLSDILSMLPFGWAYHEMVFKKRMGDTGQRETQSQFKDGRIGFRKISIRAQETFYKWEFDEENNLLGMWQLSPPSYQLKYIPFEKACLFRYKTNKNNPEGISILRNSYESYYYKTKIQKIEGIGIERDLAGLPVATVPASMISPFASDEEKKALAGIKKLVRSVRQDKVEGIVFPAAKDSTGQETGFSFSLLSTGSKRSFDTDKTINRYETRIAQSVLADFIMLGQNGKGGAYALSSDKTDLFGKAIGALLDSICAVFNTKALPLLFKLNAFTGLSGIPELKHDPIEPPAIDKIGDFLQKLTQSGATVFPNDQLTNHLLKLAGLPEIPEETLQAMAAQREQQNELLQAQLDTQRAQTAALAANSAPKAEENAKNTSSNPSEKAKQEELNKIYQPLKKNDKQENLEVLMQAELNKGFGESLTDLLNKIEELGLSAELFDYIEKNPMINSTVEQTINKFVGSFYGVGMNEGHTIIQGAAEKEAITVEMDSMLASKNLHEYMVERGGGVYAGMEETTTRIIRDTISNSLANNMNEDEIAKVLREGYAFSEERAELVATTESAVGYNTGFAQAGKNSGLVDYVMVTDGAKCGKPICINANGKKPVDWLIANPIAHPRCSRNASYVFNFGEFRTADDIAGEKR